jgi:phosphocarrier protein HPr
MNTHAILGEPVSGSVRIIHSTGLHARPSVMFTRLAKSFASAIHIADHAHGPWIDAKSIVRVMGLKVPFGTLLFIRAEGPDASKAVQQLCQLIEADFEESLILSDIENAKPA